MFFSIATASKLFVHLQSLSEHMSLFSDDLHMWTYECVAISQNIIPPPPQLQGQQEVGH